MLWHDGNTKITLQILKILWHSSRQSNRFQRLKRCWKVLMSTRYIHNADEHRNGNHKIFFIRIANIIDFNTARRNGCRSGNINPPKISQQKMCQNLQTQISLTFAKTSPSPEGTYVGAEIWNIKVVNFSSLAKRTWNCLTYFLLWHSRSHVCLAKLMAYACQYNTKENLANLSLTWLEILKGSLQLK